VKLDESAALEITAVRALEGADRAQALWTEADRAWASRAAAEVVGEGAAPNDFVATRARLVLERVEDRFKAYARAVRALRWRPWVASAIVAAAFAAGAGVDQVGGAQRINLLAPPLFAVLAWNLAVYAWLAVGFVVRYGDAARSRPLRDLVARWAGGRARDGRGEWSGAIGELAAEWATLAAPLYAARAARVLHLAAAMFAVGLLAGLYLRGIAFEYRATWESTFLAAPAVRGLLAIALAPGAMLTSVAVPSLAEIEAIRAPASENAARWLHLMVATIAVVVVAPRLLLALATWLLERHRAARLPVPLDAPYFARLLRGFHGGPAHVAVIPYSYTLPPAGTAGLERLLRGVFGANAAVTLAAPVAYGGEHAPAMLPAARAAQQVIALFNAAATPEDETHGAFVAALAAAKGSAPLAVAIVDETALRERSGADAARRDERRALWRALCAQHGLRCTFATLAADDLSAAAGDLEAALEASER
jgi:hypothetical protein